VTGASVHAPTGTRAREPPRVRHVRARVRTRARTSTTRVGSRAVGRSGWRMAQSTRAPRPSEERRTGNVGRGPRREILVDEWRPQRAIILPSLVLGGRLERACAPAVGSERGGGAKGRRPALGLGARVADAIPRRRLGHLSVMKLQWTARAARAHVHPDDARPIVAQHTLERAVGRSARGRAARRRRRRAIDRQPTDRHQLKVTRAHTTLLATLLATLLVALSTVRDAQFTVGAHHEVAARAFGELEAHARRRLASGGRRRSLVRARVRVRPAQRRCRAARRRYCARVRVAVAAHGIGALDEVNTAFR
jgi:hypothetical protein